MSISPFRKAAVTLAAATCVFGLAACHGKSTGGGGDTPTGSTTGTSTAGSTSGDAVAVKNFSFVPAKLTVSTGTKVTWTFDDSADHNVDITSGPVKFKSPDLASGKTYSYTFTKAGTYQYICSIHQYMTGTVTVK